MIVRAILLLAILLIPAETRAAGYVVRRGDTISAIAQREHVSIDSIVRANHLQNPDLVQIGRVLIIPGTVGQSRAIYGPRYYQVQWGDTLIGIGYRFGMTVSGIRALNPQLGVYPLAGQYLRLCSACSAATSASNPAVAQANLYEVHPGDTLGSIAARYGVSAASLVSVNQLLNPNLVRIGMRLTIPAGVSVPPSAAGSVYDPWTARSLIATYSDYYGVSRALAYAIAWQESGFNETLISSTGAVGIMQVEPYTGVHVSRLLGRSFNLYNARDNVQAGVYWLSRLLAYYGGDTRMAIASYYQGTASIARRGFYADTVRYVDNVEALMVRFEG